MASPRRESPQLLLVLNRFPKAKLSAAEIAEIEHILGVALRADVRVFPERKIRHADASALGLPRGNRKSGFGRMFLRKRKLSLHEKSPPFFPSITYFLLFYKVIRTSSFGTYSPFPLAPVLRSRAPVFPLAFFRCRSRPYRFVHAASTLPSSRAVFPELSLVLSLRIQYSLYKPFCQEVP